MAFSEGSLAVMKCPYCGHLMTHTTSARLAPAGCPFCGQTVAAPTNFSYRHAGALAKEETKNEPNM